MPGFPALRVLEGLPRAHPLILRPHTGNRTMRRRLVYMSSTLVGMTTTIRVSETTRDRLAKLAAERSDIASTGKAVEFLLSEHEELEALRAARLTLSEERLAEINRRRKTPLSELVPHEDVLDMLEERPAG